MKQKVLCIVLCLCMLATMLAGCSKQGGEGTKAPEETKGNEAGASADEGEMIFWGYWDGAVEESINQIVDAFNATSDVKVKYVCQSDMMNAFQAAAIAGDVPDLMLWDATEVRRYARLGQLKDIDGYMTESGVAKEDYNAESIRELTVDGKVYGLPVNIDIWGVYVNMDILSKAGITKAPTTWDELTEAAKAAMNVEGVNVGLNMAMAPNLFNSFVVSNGGSPLSEDGLTVNLDDRAKDVLEWFKELIDAGVYSTKYAASNGSDGFLTGEEAMTLWPTSMLRTYKAYGEEMNFTFVPIPAGRAAGAKAGGIQTSWCLVIPAASKHSETAYKFLEFTTHNPEYSLMWCDIVGGFSTLKEVQNDEKFANDPYLKNVLAELDNHVIRSDVPGFINLEGTCYMPEIQKMMEGNQSIDDTLAVMEKEGNKLLAQYRGE